MYTTEKENREVHITECYDIDKYSCLVEDIKSSGVPQDIQRFLLLAATRFIDIDYSNVAQFYYNLKDENIKTLFKKLNLVIVDEQDAIESGYTTLNKVIVDNIDKYIEEKSEYQLF